MQTVRWFGGRISSGQEHDVVPHGCQLVSRNRSPMWAVGDWIRTEIRIVDVGDRQITVFGECAATDPELHRLAAHGVTNGVLTAFAGSYTVVESTMHRTTVFTDPGHAWPIYLSETADGVVWGSSALALAVGWARLRRTSAWPLLAEACVSAVQRRRRSPRVLRLETLSAWSTTVARELVAEDMAATAFPAGELVGAGTDLMVEAIQAVGRTARSDAQVAEHYGVRVHNPFTDPQVIAACLA
ncbi:MAG: hypothetical protein ACRDTJ_18760, partial [Pseudonocardiaceae bacterium]